MLTIVSLGVAWLAVAMLFCSLAADYRLRF